MRTTRMLGMTAVLLCGSLIFGSPSAFADGAMDPPSGGDSTSSGCCGGHDADPPEVAHVDPPEVEQFDPPEVAHVDPPAPPPPPIDQSADPGDDFVKPVGAPIDDGIMNPWWVITDFKGRCALAHQPTFELGSLFKGPFTTFGAGAVEMGLLGAPGGWPAPVPPPAPGAAPGPCAGPAALPGSTGAPAGGAGADDFMNPWYVITDFKGRCALAHLPTYDLGFVLNGPFFTFAAGSVAMGEQGAPGWPVPVPPPAPGGPPGRCALG
jgi:hypothetical protein